MNATITLKEYLNKRKTFVIPDYQRGYIWGKNRQGEKNSVENLLEDLVTRFNSNSKVFLQGFTVTEGEDRITLIDGQQRTTCLYLLLKWLGYTERIEIQYQIRPESELFLQELNLEDSIECGEEEFQDVFFFKKTLRIIKDRLKNIDKSVFLNYLLDNVFFLYIDVPQHQAPKVFSMMNGSKAQMLPEEIIKAEILRLASMSQDDHPQMTQEWESNMLRSRYAREWDKWLHWWNRPDVQQMYHCDNIMGLLVVSCLLNKKKEVLTFENFRDKYLKQGRSIEAKQVFDMLRRLQKRFEDAFNDPIAHNKIGAILRIMDKDNRQKFINYYFVEEKYTPLSKRVALDNYYKLAFLGMTHDEIEDFKKEKYEEKYAISLNAICDDMIYLNNREFAFRLLLRLNIDEDNKQNGGCGRVFDFSIWDDERSLEHVYPKSKVGHAVDGKENVFAGGDGIERPYDYFDCFRDEIIRADGTESTTEHSIGNLVLLYGRDNSSFGNSSFEEKKGYFFDTSKKNIFKSRHLLHSIYIFAHSEWLPSDIAENKALILSNFESDYEVFNKSISYEE